jgi:DinB superfamily
MTTTPRTVQQYLAEFSARALDGMAAAIEGLTREELHFRAAPTANSIGWEAWHLFRTADNVVHFVFSRDLPLWRTQGLDEAWALPRNEQGTGMTPEEAYAMVFPDAALLAKYGRDVRAAIVPRIGALTDADLEVVSLLRPWGEITRHEAILQTLIAHGNGHLGQVSMACAILGKPVPGF